MSPNWTSTTKYTVLALILVLAVATLYFIRPLIGPLVISALLAFVLTPLVDRLALRRKMKRDTAVLIVYMVFFALLVAVPSSVTPLFLGRSGTCPLT
jgi:predicted PurR-regulated permease PerM